MDKNYRKIQNWNKEYSNVQNYKREHWNTDKIVIWTKNISQEKTRTSEERATQPECRTLDHRTLGHWIPSNYIK